MIFGRNPALLLGAIQAIIAVAVGFGLKLTPEQFGLLMAGTAAIFAVITNQQSTPVSDPTLKPGTPVNVEGIGKVTLPGAVGTAPVTDA